MSIELRFVFDTNAMVSALLFEQSVPAKAFLAARDLGDVLLSQATFAELRDVLGRSKFDRYLTQEEREEFLQRLLDEIVDGRRDYRDHQGVPRFERRQILGIGRRRASILSRVRRSGFAGPESVPGHSDSHACGVSHKLSSG